MQRIQVTQTKMQCFKLFLNVSCWTTRPSIIAINAALPVKALSGDPSLSQQNGEVCSFIHRMRILQQKW